MIIIPSLDIQNGRSRYPYNGETDPIEIIRALKLKGFHHFMITDLNGVFEGEFTHYELLKSIKNEGVFLYAGGGIRSFEAAERIVSLGVDRMILGTVAIKDQELLMALLDQYGDKTCVAVDTYDTDVYIEGWLEDSDVDVEEFVSSMSLLGVQHLIHTEINHHNNACICSNETMKKLSQTYDIRITPSIDINRAFDISEFIQCGCKELIVGGSMDFIDTDHYKQYNV